MSEIAIKGQFELPWLNGIFEGYTFNGPADRFNGGPIPMFELEEVWRIISSLYDSAKPELIQTEGGEKVLHPLGAQAWEWMKAKPTKT